MLGALLLLAVIVCVCLAAVAGVFLWASVEIVRSTTRTRTIVRIWWDRKSVTVAAHSAGAYCPTCAKKRELLDDSE